LKEVAEEGVINEKELQIPFYRGLAPNFVIGNSETDNG
jgi:hypothetical protein